MRRKLPAVVLFAGILWTCGCTEPGEVTSVGATTGGVLGAGLGAVIGNQTGSAGGGLAMGMLAGSASGALIGNALEVRQKELAQSGQQLSERERQIAAQRAALDKLRHGASDTPGGGSSLHSGTPGAGSATRSLDSPARVPVDTRSQVAARTMAPRGTEGIEQGRELAPAAFRPQAGSTVGGPAAGALVPAVSTTSSRAAVTSASSGAAGRSVVPQSADCKEAAQEAAMAAHISDVAERMLRLRKGLRLCPEDPQLHLKMAEAYRAVGRQSDAEFEQAEAARLDPTIGVPSQPVAPRREKVSMRDQARY